MGEVLVSWAMVIGGGLYLRGIRIRRWPPWRTVSFFSGLAAYAVALWSPINAYSAELFSAHMVQHMLLVVVGAPLIVAGAPLVPVLRALPPGARRSIRPLFRFRPLRAAFRAIRHPLVGGPIYVLAMYAWHIPPLYDAAVADRLVHDVEHAWFAFTSLVFWSIVIDPYPFRATLPPAARIVYLLLAGAAQNTILGGLLTFSSRLIYRSFEQTPLRYGLDPLEDQRAGGVIMWVPGDLVFLLVASVAFFQFLAEEEREQNARERAERERRPRSADRGALP